MPRKAFMRHVLDAHQVRHYTYYTERSEKNEKTMSCYSRDVTLLRSPIPGGVTQTVTRMSEVANEISQERS
jgi:hypothetical protein